MIRPFLIVCGVFVPLRGTGNCDEKIKTMGDCVLFVFPSPDGEEVSATKYVSEEEANQVLFPSPDGEEVSATTP